METHYNNIEEILAENRRRNQALSTPYDPILGVGAWGERVEVAAAPWNDGRCRVPRAMVDDADYPLATSRTAWVRLRCRHDFEYWAALCVKVKDKLTGADVPLLLNAPQRRVAGILERDRLAGRPLRLIMLKARQWGGSTLVQMYMAWVQTCLQRNWHSLICAHVKDTAASIRGMYSKMLAAYPEEFWEGDEPPKFRPYERSVNIREIAGRGCRVTIGSSENQEAVRGADYAMAHLSEVAFWSDTGRRSPEQFIRAICGAVALAPLTLIAMESTANGVGNYFHTEWLRSRRGESDKRAIFVPWHEIEIYRTPVADPRSLWDEMDAYERRLWDDGVTLEAINWYHQKRREYASHAMMQAEYPSDDIEAFANTGRNIFTSEGLERLRADCREPLAVGEVEGAAPLGPASLGNIRFCPDSLGLLHVWQWPVPRGDEPRSGTPYVVAVDIGGRSAGADYSVIAALRFDGSRPEVVAQWRGHVDHDLLAWKAARIARWYDDAILVFESNTLESDDPEGSSDQGPYILRELREYCPSLYYRSTPGGGCRPGFHTNRATKAGIITRLIGAVRDHAYIERSSATVDEMAVYEQRPNGSYGAKAGHHDDMLMTRAIALQVAAESVYSVDPSLADYIQVFRRLGPA